MKQDSRNKLERPSEEYLLQNVSNTLTDLYACVVTFRIGDGLPIGTTVINSTKWQDTV